MTRENQKTPPRKPGAAIEAIEKGGDYLGAILSPWPIAAPLGFIALATAPSVLGEISATWWLTCGVAAYVTGVILQVGFVWVFHRWLARRNR